LKIYYLYISFLKVGNDEVGGLPAANRHFSVLSKFAEERAAAEKSGLDLDQAVKEKNKAEKEIAALKEQITKLRGDEKSKEAQKKLKDAEIRLETTEKELHHLETELYVAKTQIDAKSQELKEFEDRYRTLQTVADDRLRQLTQAEERAKFLQEERARQQPQAFPPQQPQPCAIHSLICSLSLLISLFRSNSEQFPSTGGVPTSDHRLDGAAADDAQS
jgi:DNA repair exonuclease SbcCD ATPase subunit